MMNRTASLVVGTVLLVGGLGAAIGWFAFRIYVPPNKCVVLIHKAGEALPPGQRLAANARQQGIQQEVLGPGRYFYNPVLWDHEYHDLVEISAGDPTTWKWIHSLSKEQHEQIKAGKFKFDGRFPEVGVLVRRVGPPAPDGSPVVDRNSPYSGILKEVLTPGTYRINPYVYQIEKYPAVVIPSGFVGVVTNLFGAAAGPAATSAAAESGPAAGGLRPLARAGQRGTVGDVLQPGVYFVNPKMQTVIPVEIGFNEYSQVKVSDLVNERISFPSDTGFDINIGVTIIWGIDPRHAAQIINEFGNVDRVLDTVIGSQLPSICRNIGSTYSARDFIHGEKREKFQRDLTEKLQEVCRKKNVDVLLALVREIEVHAPAATAGSGAEVTEDLKRTIQQSYIAIENRLTKDKQREAATVRAELEQARKQVDVARETIQAETRVMVADLLAAAEKKAAEIGAQAELEIATIQQEVAGLDAQRTEILGRANADVEKLKKQAEADGYRLLVQAFGGGQAFNLYTFAENFKPESIQLFFAGEGTFWTDLSRIEELGAAKVLQSGSQPEKKP